MEKNTVKKRIPYYSKSGILYTILPFYGTYNTWARILVPIWLEAKRVWDNNQAAFEHLDKNTQWIIQDYQAVHKFCSKILDK